MDTARVMSRAEFLSNRPAWPGRVSVWAGLRLDLAHDVNRGTLEIEPTVVPWIRDLTVPTSEPR